MSFTAPTPGRGRPSRRRPPPPTGGLPPATLREALSRASRSLADAGLPSPILEAEVMAMHALGLDRAGLYAHLPRTLSPGEVAAMERMVERRLLREPLPYIVGHREFFGVDLLVGPGALVPRPETETLVEEALRLAPGVLGEAGRGLVVDVGTGSGCVAVALSANLPRATIVATDVSRRALEVAAANVRRHGLQARVRLVQGDLLAPVAGPVDLVVANLPYVADGEVASLEPEVSRFEPRVALLGGADGTSLIRRLLEQATGVLAPRGALALEVDPRQRQALERLADGLWQGGAVRVVSDLAGRERVLVVEAGRKAAP